MADMPDIDVVVIANGEPARVTGEPTVTIAAPAIGNAIFNAVGARVTWAADHFGQCERGHAEGDLAVSTSVRVPPDQLGKERVRAKQAGSRSHFQSVDLIAGMFVL
jgi:hypothetical protein